MLTGSSTILLDDLIQVSSAGIWDSQVSARSSHKPTTSLFWWYPRPLLPPSSCPPQMPQNVLQSVLQSRQGTGAGLRRRSVRTMSSGCHQRLRRSHLGLWTTQSWCAVYFLYTSQCHFSLLFLSCVPFTLITQHTNHYVRWFL